MEWDYIQRDYDYRLKSHHTVGYIRILPGRGDIGWSHSVYCNYDKRGEGNGQKAHQDRLDFARDHLNLNYLLCVVTQDNAVQHHILKKFGWKKLSEYYDPSYEKDVTLYGKDLRCEDQGKTPDYLGDRENDV